MISILLLPLVVVLMQGSILSVAGSTFVGNFADFDGSGAAVEGLLTVAVANCSFTDNSARRQPYHTLGPGAALAVAEQPAWRVAAVPPTDVHTEQPVFSVSGCTFLVCCARWLGCASTVSQAVRWASNDGRQTVVWQA